VLVLAIRLRAAGLEDILSLLVLVIRLPTALWVLVLVIRLPTALWALVLVIRLPTALWALVMVIRLPAAALWVLVMVTRLPAAALWVLVVVIQLPAAVPCLAGRIAIPIWRRKHLKSFQARTHRLLLKPEGRQLDSRTLWPLWQRVQLLVLPVAYT
jgi:hypothetical protein